ncbi:MAG: NUDIX domain-containing protein [Pseudomonadota bacterium]
MWRHAPAASPAAKACPVILRGDAILAFRHPRAGVQLVKGTIEPGEDPAEAAVRELWEEAGIHARPARSLGTIVIGPPPLTWSFWLMRASRLPQRWAHHCDDDGGQVFRFLWWPLQRPAGRAWHPIHRRALAKLRTRLGRRGSVPTIRS